MFDEVHSETDFEIMSLCDLIQISIFFFLLLLLVILNHSKSKVVWIIKNMLFGLWWPSKMPFWNTSIFDTKGYVLCNRTSQLIISGWAISLSKFRRKDGFRFKCSKYFEQVNYQDSGSESCTKTNSGMRVSHLPCFIWLTEVMLLQVSLIGPFIWRIICCDGTKNWELLTIQSRNEGRK